MLPRHKKKVIANARIPLTMLRRPPSITNFDAKLANEKFSKAFRKQLTMDFSDLLSKNRDSSHRLDKTNTGAFGAFNSSLKLGNLQPKGAGFLGQNLVVDKPRKTM